VLAAATGCPGSAASAITAWTCACSDAAGSPSLGTPPANAPALTSRLAGLTGRCAGQGGQHRFLLVTKEGKQIFFVVEN
jgi:hypothetical protein